MTSGNAPDGVSEMVKNRQERKPRRRPRELPPPRHPRPPVEPLTGGEEEKPAEQPTDTGSRQDDSGVSGAAPGPSVPEPSAAPVPPEPPRKGAQKAAAGPSGSSRSKSVLAAPASPAANGKAAKAAADAALSWSAAWRKQSERLQTLAAAVRRAREQGAPPLVLGAALADAEQRAGVALPAEVWAAADPEQG